MKLKSWEIALVVLVLLVIGFLIFYQKEKALPETKFIIPEGATDEYIVENAFKNADEVACEYIEDEAKKNECLGLVEDRKFLDKSVEETREIVADASSVDKKLLARAMLTKESSLCDQIVDESTREKCFSLIV